MQHEKIMSEETYEKKTNEMKMIWYDMTRGDKEGGCGWCL